MFELLDGLPAGARPGDALLGQARMLDRFYIPSRYPNAHPSGPASQFYARGDAQQGVMAAEAVVSYCERQVFPAGQG